MANAPKKNYERIQKVRSAWKDLRPNKSFAEMTLDQYTQAIVSCEMARATIVRLANELTAAQNQRDEADDTRIELAQRIVSAVKADAEEGEDGVLYGTMGYVRKSERKSGLSRKAKPVETTPTA